MSSNPFTSCSTCDYNRLTLDTFFCPRCGATALNNVLLTNKPKGLRTTADFDPANPNVKPWRDPIALPNRPKLPPKLQSLPDTPWRAVMHNLVSDKDPLHVEQIRRRAAVLRRVKKKDKSEDSQNASYNETVGQGASAVTGKVIYYKNFMFQRRGDKSQYIKNLVISNKKRKQKNFDDTMWDRGEQTYIHAIAVYEATWLPVPGYTVHISYVDRHHDKKDDYISKYFIRVGVTYEEPSVTNKQETEEEDDPDNNWAGDNQKKAAKGGTGELVILDVLQNDIGKLMTNEQVYWVDLHLIRPEEYYMSSYLQKSLEYIARRVHVTPSAKTINAIDALYLVEMARETELSEEREKGAQPKMVVVITEQDINLFKRRHKRAIARKKKENDFYAIKEYDKTEERDTARSAAAATSPQSKGKDDSDDDNSSNGGSPDSNKAPDSMNKRAMSPVLLRPGSSKASDNEEPARDRSNTPLASRSPTRPENTKDRSVGTALGPHGQELHLSLDRSIATKTHRIPIGKLWEANYTLSQVKMSVKYPDGELLMNEALRKKSEEAEEHLLFETSPAQEIQLHITPMTSEAGFLGVKVISFEVKTIPILLGDQYTEDIDSLLAQGFQAADDLLNRLCRLLSFKKEEGKYTLSISGVANIPFMSSAVEDHDSDSDSEEIASKAVLEFTHEVQQEFVVNIISDIVLELKEIAEKERLELMMRRSYGAVVIQKYWRGGLIRMHKLIERKRIERKALRAKAKRAAIKIQCFARVYFAKLHVHAKRREWVAKMKMIQQEKDAQAWAQKVAGGNNRDQTPEEGIRSYIEEKQAFEAEQRAGAVSAVISKDFTSGTPGSIEIPSLDIDNTVLRVEEVQKETVYLPIYNRCKCHDLAIHEYDMEIKDTPLKIYGVFFCGDICENSSEVLMSSVREMFVDSTARNNVMIQGDGHWRLYLTVVEAEEDVKPEDICSAEVTISAEHLEEIALVYNNAINAMEEVVADSEDDEKRFNEEDSDSKLVLHECMLKTHSKSDIFRRCCTGINISYQYDGSMEATFDAEVVHDAFNHFFDEEGDLVLGI